MSDVIASVEAIEEVRPVELAADLLDDQLIGQLVDRARASGLQLTGEGGLLQQLTTRVLESALEGEITDHLGYEKHDKAGAGSGNSRNGVRSKTVLTEVGPVEIDVPRDREGSFEPQIVKKRQRRLTGVDEMVLSLSAWGLTHGDISAHLAEVYGASVSKSTISTITDKVMDGMAEWQNRPLDAIYPVIFIDCIHVKVRDGQVANRPIYVALAVTVDGTRDILGLWAGDGGEGAKYWLQVLTEIKNRGVEDVCMVVCDGLKGLPDAIGTVWPQAITQTCVVHRSRQRTTWWSSGSWACVEAKRSAAVAYRRSAGVMAGPWASRTGSTSLIAFHRVLRHTPNSSARVSRPQTRRRWRIVARMRSPSVIFCRNTPPRVPGRRSPPRWRCRRFSIAAA
ncbi:hypothetical protein FHR36_007302 [Kitasatospora paracochleata]|uniref:Mutator family transposase n=1 Tax=Kitasatospora paracochleata TaxID=58354 RepID=A0ABT1J9Q9_9ACTN|nr:hypothetical protein [Kitasatospora paracochleata]